MRVLAFKPIWRTISCNARLFCDWSQSFSACHLSAEVTDVLNNASKLAKTAGSSSVESEFVLKSLLSSGLLRQKTLRSIALDKESLSRELDGYIRRGKYSNNGSRIGCSTSSVLLYAQSLAVSRGKAVDISDLSEGLIKHDAFLQTLKNKKSTTESRKEQQDNASCLIDLTNEASCGRLGSFVGRESELERLKSILYRMRKNNVLIVGPAGVGKTSLVERLAIDMLQEDDSVKILSLDLCRLYSGQGTRGELESKLNYIFQRIKNNKTILFIDEIHHLIQNQEGGTNVTNLFKPIMTHGDVKIIGSTTLMEYHRYFRKDRAFERRFEVMRIRENTVDETLIILDKVKADLESYHNVIITNDAIMAAIELTRRFNPRRALPDKAIDILDEAAMFAGHTAKPEKYVRDVLNRRKNRLIAEAIRSGDLSITKKQIIDDIDSQLSGIQALRLAMCDLRKKVGELERLKRDHEKNGDLLKASEVCNHSIPELMRKLSKMELESAALTVKALAQTPSSEGTSSIPLTNNSQNCGPMIVDETTIAKVMSRQAEIPVEVLLRHVKRDYQSLIDNICSVVLQQDNAVKRALVHFYKHVFGLNSLKGAAGALCFVGPQGVGKRTLLRHVAKLMGLAMKHISCDHLHGSNGTNYLVGSPPGYVGHREGGVLTEWVKDNPYSVIFLEEAHLMHPNVANLIASAIGNGYLIDNQGEECRLDETFIVASYKTEQEIQDTMKLIVDDVIVFDDLDPATVRMLIISKLSEISFVNLRYTEAAVEHICALGNYTSSAIKVLNNTVHNGICRLIISGDLVKGDTCKLLLRAEVTLRGTFLPITQDLVICKKTE